MANSILDPVEDITIEQWAGANAKLASGATVDDIIKMLGIDAPKWDRVNNEWLTRMRNDTSFTISGIYGKAFTAKAEGNLGSSDQINAEKYSFEQWIELMVAQDVLGQQGRDAQDVLKDFGLTVTDYTNISSYWSGKMMADYSIAMQMQPLMDKYKAKYSSMTPGNAHTDLDF
jgi:hypothetical protein